jgi:predicted PurR-regulated permease PerM
VARALLRNALKVALHMQRANNFGMTYVSEQVNNKMHIRDQRMVRLLRILGGLASIYTLYFAQSLIIPVVFSALVALLLGPLVKRLKRLHVPRSISAIVLLSALLAPLTLLSVELAEPVQRWMKVLPKLSVQVTQELNEISDAFEMEKGIEPKKQPVRETTIFSGWFSSEKEEEPVVTEKKESAVEQKIKQGGLDALLSMLTAAPIFLAQIFGSFILILFLLIFGPPLFSVFVHDFPIISDKKRASALVKSIQQALSHYIVTISLINCGLGVATALALGFFGVDDAILWGVIVALFNFVPYLGSLFSLSILLIVGVVQFGMTPIALLPGGVFFAINIAESQIVTPAILGRSMQVNPLIIILWLLITGWLWGILGVLLAVPLLVCIKLALERMQIFPHWLKLIEADESDLVK